MNNSWLLFYLCVFSLNSYSQTIEPGSEKFKIMASASVNEGYSYRDIYNYSLTDLGSAVAWVTLPDSSQNTRFIKITATGQIFNLTPTSGYTSDNHFTMSSAMAMSQNEQFYYYLYIDYLSINGYWKVAQLSINNGISSISTIYTASPNQFLFAPIATNNKGTVAAIVLNADPITNEAVSYNILRISKLGQVTILETIPAANFSYSNIVINDLDTVFIQNYNYPNSLHAYNNNGQKVEIDQFVNYNSDQPAQPTNIITAAHPEGLIYYLKNNLIMSSENEVIFNPNSANQFGQYLQIYSFFVTPEKDVYYAAYDVNSKSYLMKNNEAILTSGQSFLGVDLYFVSGIKGNNNGEISFVARSIAPQSIDYLVKYSGTGIKKTCKVSDKTNKEVKFFSQDDPIWKDKPYAFGPRKKNPTAKEISDNRMTIVGCVTTSLSMLFDYYGINILPKNADGTDKAFNPDSLNDVFKVISDLNNNIYTSYTRTNDVIWTEVANAGRSIYQDKCFSDAKLNLDFQTNKETYKKNCVEQSKSKISHKGKFRWDVADQTAKEAAFEKIEKEICDGNPVLLRVAREQPEKDPKTGKLTTKYKEHSVIAIATDYNSEGKLTFKVNDPSRDNGKTANITLETMTKRDKIEGPQYKHVVGYDLYRPQKDPSMISIISSDNIDFVLTDNLGRRTGFDPTTQTKYAEIPNGVYTYEATAPNFQNDEVEINENLPSANYLFISEDVQSGDYQIKTFANTTGQASLTISKTDADGFTNDTEEHTFNIIDGSQEIINFKHSVASLPDASADLTIQYALYQLSKEHKHFHSRKKHKQFKEKLDSVKLYGQIKLTNNQKIKTSDVFNLMIGSLTDYNQAMPLSSFKRRTHKNEIFYDFEKHGYKIVVSENGKFWVELKNIDLNAINTKKWGKITIGINDQVGRSEVSLNCNKNICFGAQNNE